MKEARNDHSLKDDSTMQDRTVLEGHKTGLGNEEADMGELGIMEGLSVRGMTSSEMLELDLDSTTDEFDVEANSYVDKYESTVMNGNNEMARSLCEGENVMSQGNVETVAEDDVQPNKGHATRRSVRERKLPTALTDFILY
ncbi:hypothetical protein V6N13_025714 [Hibiscus sabdariffa]